MGQIQNQFNQALALALGGAMTAESATAGIRELEATGLAEKGAKADAQFYGAEAGKLYKEFRGITNEAQLKDWEDEAIPTQELYKIAAEQEAGATEARRQAVLKYGTKAEKKAAMEEGREEAENRYIAQLGSYDPAKMAAEKRAQFQTEAREREASLKQEQERQEEITRINNAYEERMKTLKDAARRRYTEGLAADAKMAILKREMEDMTRGK